MKQHRIGSATQNNHKIGVNFARIALPKMAFGPESMMLKLNETLELYRDNRDNRFRSSRGP